MNENRRQMEAGIANQLHYYRLLLAEEGVADINQYLATRLSSIIRLSEAQEEYIKGRLEDSETRLNITELLDDLIVLAQVMRRTQNFEEEYLKVTEETLKQIKLMIGGV